VLILFYQLIGEERFQWIFLSEMHAAKCELADHVKGRYVSNDQSISPCLSRETTTEKKNVFGSYCHSANAVGDFTFYLDFR